MIWCWLQMKLMCVLKSISFFSLLCYFRGQFGKGSVCLQQLCTTSMLCVSCGSYKKCCTLEYRTHAVQYYWSLQNVTGTNFKNYITFYMSHVRIVSISYGFDSILQMKQFPLWAFFQYSISHYILPSKLALRLIWIILRLGYALYLCWDQVLPRCNLFFRSAFVFVYWKIA